MSWLHPIIPPFSVTIVFLAVSHAAAFITTILRLLYRFLVSRLWWDDFWAFVALVSDTLVWTVYASVPIKIVEKPLWYQMFWKLAQMEGGTLAIWASRLSIAVTIVRLAPPGPFNRLCKGAAYLFGVLYLVVAIEKIFCAGTNWHLLPYCALPKYTNITVLVVDLISDIWLAGSPAYMMMKMKVSRRHRRLIIVIFSCEIFVTFASIVFAYFNMAGEAFLAGIASHVQLGISIVVANLLVLVTYIYRIFTSSDDDDESTVTSTESSSDRQKAPHVIDLRTRQISLQLTDIGSSFGPPSSNSEFSPSRLPTRPQAPSPSFSPLETRQTRLTTTFDLTDFSTHYDSLGGSQGSHLRTTPEMIKTSTQP